MTYKTLNDVITRLAEYGHLPKEALEQFEVASGSRGKEREAVMLFGLMPANRFGAVAFIAASCELFRCNIIITDTERIDCYDIRLMPDWEQEFYRLGARFGLEHDYLETKLMQALRNEVTLDSEADTDYPRMTLEQYDKERVLDYNFYPEERNVLRRLCIDTIGELLRRYQELEARGFFGDESPSVAMWHHFRSEALRLGVYHTDGNIEDEE